MTDNFVVESGADFQKFVAALHRRLGDKIMTSWMSDLQLETKTDDSVTLSTESKLKCDTIGQRFVLLMKDAWCEEVGPIRRLQIITRDRLSADAARVDALKPMNGGFNGRPASASVRSLNGGYESRILKGFDADRKFDAERKEAPRPARAEARVEKKSADEHRSPALDDLLLPIDERATFDRFAVDESNAMAFAAAQQVFVKEAPSELTYLYGPSGVGKTHLLFAIGNEHRRRANAGVSSGGCAYLTYNAMQSGCVSAVFSNGVLALQKDLMAQDIVLIDDIHHLISSPRTQTEILNLVNAFLASGRRIVFAGEMSPAKLAEAGMNPRLCDRLSGGMSVAIRPGEASLRARVLKARAEMVGASGRVDDDAVAYVAENFPNSLREAIGALHQLLLAYASKDGVIGRADAELALRARLSEFRRPPNLDEAAEATSMVFGISVDELKGRGQQQRLARARHAYVIIGREVLRESFPRIARALGRDHTTAMSGYRRGHALLERDKRFQAAIAAIREKLGAPAH